MSGSSIDFSYIMGNNYSTKTLSTYEFKDSMLKLFDGVSGIILSWFGYLCKNSITYKDIYENKVVPVETSLFFEKLSLSTLLTSCDKIANQKINTENGIIKQVNLEFSGIDLDTESRIFLGLCTVKKSFFIKEIRIKRFYNDFFSLTENNKFIFYN